MFMKPYRKTVDVELTEEDKRLRADQATRAWGAVERKEAAILKVKEDAKAAVKRIEDEKTTAIGTARMAARAYETGVEPRELQVEDVIVGRFVITRIVDDKAPEAMRGVTVEERQARDEELEAWDAKTNPKVAPEPQDEGDDEPFIAPGDGHSVDDIGKALDRALPEILTKPRAELLVHKALIKAVPTSSPMDRKLCLKRNLDAKTIGEDAEGKLVWAPQEPVEAAPPSPVH
jgi:hypothetical protein